MSEDTLYYDLPGFAVPMSAAEVEALRSMMEHPGWGVFMKHRNIEMEASRDKGLSLIGDDEDRIMHRAVYHAFMNDLTYQERFNDEMANCKPVTRELLDVVV